MNGSRRTKMAWLVLTVVSALAAACTAQAGAPVGEREQDRILAASDAALTAVQIRYRDSLREFNDVVVPQAKKEGELNWYACTDAQEAEGWIRHFNRFYPEVTVNHVYGQGFDLVEKIAAEVSAGKVQGDSYICGISSARNLSNRPGVGMAPNVPSALNPDIKWNFPVVEGNGLRVLWSTNGIAGLKVNTEHIPKDRYPKTWWEVIRDPYWNDLTRRGLVEIADPRRTGFSHQLLYSLRLLHADYGEPWVRELAALKPRKSAPGIDRLVTGEVWAQIASSISAQNRENQDPVDLVCPAPGCVQSYLAPASVLNGPHPNAARLWAEFWLTKEGQAFLAERWYTINRSDILVDPKVDWKNFPQAYIATEDHDIPTNDALIWNQQSNRWDY